MPNPGLEPHSASLSPGRLCGCPLHPPVTLAEVTEIRQERPRGWVQEVSKRRHVLPPHASSSSMPSFATSTEVYSSPLRRAALPCPCFLSLVGRVPTCLRLEGANLSARLGVLGQLIADIIDKNVLLNMQKTIARLWFDGLSSPKLLLPYKPNYCYPASHYKALQPKTTSTLPIISKGSPAQNYFYPASHYRALQPKTPSTIDFMKGLYPAQMLVTLKINLGLSSPKI